MKIENFFGMKSRETNYVNEYINWNRFRYVVVVVDTLNKSTHTHTHDIAKSKRKIFLDIITMM